MIGLSVTTTDNTKQVLQAADRATFRSLGHAVATIRKDVQGSIVSAPGPSPVGTPPHTHTATVTKKGKPRKGQLPRAIAFDVQDGSALVGPKASVVGEAGRAHELGEEFHGETFEERPFMLPALERNQDRFAQDWAGSFGD